MDIKKVCDLIEARKDELFTLLSSLVKINSENCGSVGNEKNCAEYILSLCKDLGLESEMYSPLDLKDFKSNPDYMEGRDLENRYNVTAKWKGKENQNKLMIMGHIDTVEIGNRESWEKEPLSGEIADGKIFGRGACDDKYALATALFIIKLLKEANLEPKANLLFSAYCDEELGGSHGAMASVIKDPCEIVLNMDGRPDRIWHCASGGQVVTYRYRVNGTVDSAEKTARALPIVMDEIAKFGARRRKELEETLIMQARLSPQQV